MLNRLQLVHLAVSLGGTESLAEHPATMTHADVDPARQREMGITSVASSGSRSGSSTRKT